MPFDLSTFDLTHSGGRVAALEPPGEYFTTRLIAANGDRHTATEPITHAIRSVYDVNEATDPLPGTFFVLAEAAVE